MNATNNRKNVLFIGSLVSKSKMYDGERRKTTDVFSAFQTIPNLAITLVNYTKNKYIQSIRLAFLLLFRKFDLVFLSKSISGGTIALDIIHRLRKDKLNIVFYVIGNGFTGFEQYKTVPQRIAICSALILESPALIPTFQRLGAKKCHVFPCLKPSYQTPLVKKLYDDKTQIHLLYFSRICANKGIFTAINGVLQANQTIGWDRFSLDIAGGLDNPKELAPTGEPIETYILNLASAHSCIHYLGLTLRAADEDSYKRISQYDLHVIPTTFGNECAPGSVFDMFIAGVPTLSSNFESAKYIMSDKDSYFYELGNEQNFIDQLLAIHQRPEELSYKRVATHEKGGVYTIDSFARFIKEEIL